ncbi:T9SS type A sorting domain-containing protein [Fulvivirgaceae bacterium BMA10]|uniref:T9SS type A sorting domain-containing protein n=1 Tax=Splendidivirga corallicola TaxID=3051826 RepID=A0ABT8KIW4_9BACT|nr:T9SS type A sorting domain-containing protein [Fulvivirgaceae bacterium BMA10]
MKKCILCLSLLIVFAIPSVLYGQSSKEYIANVNGETVKINYDVDLYPNPATEFVNIKSKGDEFLEIGFEMYSLIGNKLPVQVEKVDKENYKIPVKEFSSGYYLLIIKDKRTRYRRAFKFQKL